MVAQTELEEILDVFNVAKYKTNDKHILEYTGTSTNPKVKRLLRHLSQAIEVDEIIERMKMEDEVENAFAAEKKQRHFPLHLPFSSVQQFHQLLWLGSNAEANV